jgi:hypothetical protein
MGKVFRRGMSGVWFKYASVLSPHAGDTITIKVAHTISLKIRQLNLGEIQP